MSKCKECGCKGYGWHDCFNEVLWMGEESASFIEWRQHLERLYKEQLKARGEAERELREYKRKFDMLCMVFDKVMDMP